VEEWAWLARLLTVLAGVVAGVVALVLFFPWEMLGFGWWGYLIAFGWPAIVFAVGWAISD